MVCLAQCILGCLQEIRQDQDVCIQVCQERAAAVLARQFKNRWNHGGALVVTAHIGDELHPQLISSPGNTFFLTDHQDFNFVPKLHPGADGVMLDDLDMRMDKGFGRGENSQQCHAITHPAGDRAARRVKASTVAAPGVGTGRSCGGTAPIVQPVPGWMLVCLALPAW